MVSIAFGDSINSRAWRTRPERVSTASSPLIPSSLVRSSYSSAVSIRAICSMNSLSVGAVAIKSAFAVACPALSTASVSTSSNTRAMPRAPRVAAPSGLERRWRAGASGPSPPLQLRRAGEHLIDGALAHLTWPGRRLRSGDEVSIRVVEAASADRASSRRRDRPIPRVKLVLGMLADSGRMLGGVRGQRAKRLGADIRALLRRHGTRQP